MITDKKRHDLLKDYCSTDKNRPSFHKPFLADLSFSEGGKVETCAVATDTHVLIVMPALTGIATNEAAAEVTNELIVRYRQRLLQDKYEVSLEGFRLAHYEMNDYEKDCRSKNCFACDGDGYVDFTFEHNFDTYTVEAECPVCDGDCGADDSCLIEVAGVGIDKSTVDVILRVAYDCSAERFMLRKGGESLGIFEIQFPENKIRIFSHTPLYALNGKRIKCELIGTC